MLINTHLIDKEEFIKEELIIIPQKFNCHIEIKVSFVQFPQGNLVIEPKVQLRQQIAVASSFNYTIVTNVYKQN